MAKLDHEARMIIENNIDSLLENPLEYEQEFKRILADMGIEPNLETVLSFVSGFLVGQTLINIKKQSSLEQDSVEYFEQIGAMDQIISRRAWELREAMIKARMK